MCGIIYSVEALIAVVYAEWSLEDEGTRDINLHVCYKVKITELLPVINQCLEHLICICKHANYFFFSGSSLEVV